MTKQPLRTWHKILSGEIQQYLFVVSRVKHQSVSMRRA